MNLFEALKLKLTTKKENDMNYTLLDHSIVLNYDGKTVSIAEGDDRFDKVVTAIREKRLNDIPAIVEIERGFEGSGIELRDGILYKENHPIPPELNARIIRHQELGLPFEPLLLFWEKLKLNPSFNARNQLFAFLTHNGHPLTDDGCFIAYRGVTEDFKDKHTGRFDNSVGSVCEMARELVDDNPNNTCSTGLHVACYNYAKDFGSKLVEVKVNPKDVVAVPTDYNGTKMRVCKFEVMAIGEKLLNDTIYGVNTTMIAQPIQESEENEEVNEEEDNCMACGASKSLFHNFCPDCGIEF